MKRLLGLVAVVASFAPAARGDDAAPAVVAWWQVSPVGAVSGATAEDGQVVVQSGADGHHAVAGLAFDVPALTDATLTIPIVDDMTGAAVAACIVREPFEPTNGGAADEVPEHDCTSATDATVDGTSLVVADLESFASDGALRVLLVATTAGRVVLDGQGAVLAITPVPASPTTTTPPATEAAPTPAPAVRPIATTSTTLVVEIGQGETVVVASSPAVAPSSFTRRDDRGARTWTAVVLGALLCGFVILGRDSGSRLRPATLPWRRD